MTGKKHFKFPLSPKLKDEGGRMMDENASSSSVIHHLSSLNKFSPLAKGESEGDLIGMQDLFPIKSQRAKYAKLEAWATMHI